MKSFYQENPWRPEEILLKKHDHRCSPLSACFLGGELFASYPDGKMHDPKKSLFYGIVKPGTPEGMPGSSAVF